jgi:5'-methylthioadenosine phosphorylase
MTQYPEAYLARELEICYVNISLITDYDVGLAGASPVTHEDVLKVFASNNERVKQGIFKIVEAMPAERTCGCGSALAGAR